MFDDSNGVFHDSVPCERRSTKSALNGHNFPLQRKRRIKIQQKDEAYDRKRQKTSESSEPSVQRLYEKNDQANVTVEYSAPKENMNAPPVEEMYNSGVVQCTESNVGADPISFNSNQSSHCPSAVISNCPSAVISNCPSAVKLGHYVLSSAFIPGNHTFNSNPSLRYSGPDLADDLADCEPIHDLLIENMGAIIEDIFSDEGNTSIQTHFNQTIEFEDLPANDNLESQLTYQTQAQFIGCETSSLDSRLEDTRDGDTFSLTGRNNMSPTAGLPANTVKRDPNTASLVSVTSRMVAVPCSSTKAVTSSSSVSMSLAHTAGNNIQQMTDSSSSPSSTTQYQTVETETRERKANGPHFSLAVIAGKSGEENRNLPACTMLDDIYSASPAPHHLNGINEVACISMKELAHNPATTVHDSTRKTQMNLQSDYEKQIIIQKLKEISIQRCLEKGIDPHVSFPAYVAPKLTEEDQQKRIVKRVNNKKSAVRYRIKTKASLDADKKECEELERKQELLKTEVAEKEKEKTRLFETLIASGYTVSFLLQRLEEI